MLRIKIVRISRRFLWNFFRLENEHLNNCGEFRAIRDISIVPLETVDRDQHVLLRMMDEPDGVTNRRQKGRPQSTVEEDDDDKASVVSDLEAYEDIDAKSDVSSLNEFERFDFDSRAGSQRGSNSVRAPSVARSSAAANSHIGFGR